MTEPWLNTLRCSNQRSVTSLICKGLFHRFINVTLIAVILFVASSGAAQTQLAPGSAIPSDDLKKYPGLLLEFGQLMKKIQDGVQYPAPRGQSRLLPLLPKSTVVYAAFPNYGEASHQALTIFQQELKENAELRAWWTHSEMASNGPKIEDALEKFSQISQYLGDEIVVSASLESHKYPNVLILSEVRKPGLKSVLEQMSNELGGKAGPPIRVLDLQTLPTTPDILITDQLVVLVRPDFVVAAPNVAALRSFNAVLDHNTHDFAAIPFGQRMARTYEGGVTAVAGADMQEILKQAPPGTDQKTLQRTGFADMKYLVWEHNGAADQAASQVELSFTGPRHGVASWLAAPGPLGSLDFVSAKALAAISLLLKPPAEIFDDVRDLSSTSNPNAFSAIDQMQQALNISLRNDVLSRLSGEITLEMDSMQPDAVWKVILKTNDAAGLQEILSRLMTVAQIKPAQFEDEGVTYHTIRIPAGQKIMEIGYAFLNGYLVVASSRETALQAIRLQRSGESLSKSKKFLPALPPGNLAEVSALLYEDPMAMAAISMGRVSPEIASLLPASRPEVAPAVIAAYGEPTALREASRSGGVDAGVILIGAAVAIPNLLRARIAANESSAVAMTRTVNTAQITYSAAFPQRGYARDLASLGPDPNNPSDSTPEHGNFVDATLGNASCTGTAWCEKSGYRFKITAACKQRPCTDYTVLATPISTSTGTRSFCSTSDRVIRFKTTTPLTSPISASECLKWAPLQ